MLQNGARKYTQKVCYTFTQVWTDSTTTAADFCTVSLKTQMVIPMGMIKHGKEMQQDMINTWQESKLSGTHPPGDAQRRVQRLQ